MIWVKWQVLTSKLRPYQENSSRPGRQQHQMWLQIHHARRHGGGPAVIGLQALDKKPGENGEEMLVFICFHGKMLVFIWKKCENMVFAWVLASLNGVFMFLFQKNNTGNKSEGVVDFRSL